MRLPLIWRPAPDANIEAAEVSAPVGHVDLAQTFCQIAGIPEPEWVEGAPLPISETHAQTQKRERVLTEWESEHGPVSLNLQSIYRDQWVCTRYGTSSLYEGTEGELYNLAEDPGSLVNRWDDPTCQALKADLITDLDDSLPAAREPRLPRLAPV
jgi:arylsulfatase A-like enzyme